MGVIADITDRVAVMYRGRLVEHGATEKILGNPDHPYTQSLISAVPRPDIKLIRFPQVTYIEDVAEKNTEIDITEHWLGKAREYETAPGPLLELKNISMRFTTKPAFLRKNRIFLDAVNNVSLDIHEGEVFGLVGESGSGKSTVARIICGLYTPVSGAINFAGTELTALKKQSDLDPFRKQMQMIFQDPFASLNPRMMVGETIAEPIYVHGLAKGKEVTDRVEKLLDRVGLTPDYAVRYPHELSGGQRQRIGIARALALEPKLIIADEAVSALDVSIQAQVVNLMMELQEDLGLSYLFISHDMAVIERVSHRVGVMYLGEIVELGLRSQIFENPQHPYTKKLMSAVPVADPRKRKTELNLMTDEIPSLVKPVDYEPEKIHLTKVDEGHYVMPH